MNSTEIKDLKSLLASPKKIVIIPHKNPDGDAIGSTVALYNFLKSKEWKIKQDRTGWMIENIEKIKAYNHSYDIFHLLKNKNIITGIITSKERKNTLAICSKYGFSPDEIITPNDVKKGKPCIDQGQEYLKRTGLNSQDVLYVGDMESDFIFAKNINFHFAFANYGYGNINGTNFNRIDDLLDIMEII